MKFTKMQGAGNDYVYVNCFEERVENPEQLAIKVSNRNFGIGSRRADPDPPLGKGRCPDADVQRGRLGIGDVRQRHPLRGKICL